ncbi:serine hydrolase [Mariprofundus sp. KV]|uniref:serine hydrolase n=1 Tax=Mariprofundus sp. KV TaxID=2608715 RepID=UPI0015A06CA5|nr:serine hydrolase [Mariprofundus sp. KV]NWF36475.1 hypothetical protein [Mariprofundus sp. KV]
MRSLLLCMLLLLWQPPLVSAYPLDGAEETGISRLQGYQLARQGEVTGNKLPAGALLLQKQVKLHLQGFSGDPLLNPDPLLREAIIKLLGEDGTHYSVSLLDISDAGRPRYAEVHGDQMRNPGSLGKLVLALALFQTLADIYPDDVAARQQILRNSMITADRFIRTDHHKVPFWLPEQKRLIKRPIVEGDSANFWSYLDWMLSASSNAAASMVLKHTMLLNHFGRDYPVSRAREEAYFNEHSTRELGKRLTSLLQQAVKRSGLDPERLRQGGFFSREGKRRVPGTNSVCTTRELMRYLLHMEQGRLVDAWSSLRLKRLLYMTERRIRYASAPELSDAALYFKSGSFYRCEAEAGFVCRKYAGNKLNVMNSVAIVEAPEGELRYMVAITSNVLKKNAALQHRQLATRLHALIRQQHRDADQQ